VFFCFAWGDISAVAPIFTAASGECTGNQSAPAPALAEFLRPEFNPIGAPVERLRRDLLLVYYTSISSARRILEPLVVSAGAQLLRIKASLFALLFSTRPLYRKPSRKCVPRDLRVPHGCCKQRHRRRDFR
jgi:hypothetical protein